MHAHFTKSTVYTMHIFTNIGTGNTTIPNLLLTSHTYAHTLHLHTVTHETHQYCMAGNFPQDDLPFQCEVCEAYTIHSSGEGPVWLYLHWRFINISKIYRESWQGLTENFIDVAVDCTVCDLCDYMLVAFDHTYMMCSTDEECEDIWHGKYIHQGVSRLFMVWTHNA